MFLFATLRMSADLLYCAVFERFNKGQLRILDGDQHRDGSPLEAFMSFGLGSRPNGITLSHLTCGNQVLKGSGGKGCFREAVLSCTKCFLVKYCSERCLKQHAAKHKADCTHPLLSDDWGPAWITEEREPSFTNPPPYGYLAPSLWGDIPGIDWLRLEYNEGYQTQRNLRICAAACKNIRSLIKTVNSLPKDYSGRLDVLLNEVDEISLNRNLVQLFCLLNPGPSVDASAELVTHLMYSAALPATSAAYLRRCVALIYGDGAGDGDMSFRCSLKTRGVGRLFSLQTINGIKRPMEMLLSNHELHHAIKSMRNVTANPRAIDDRDREFTRYKPAHRLAFARFRETGVLAPFSFDVSGFNHPNRLLFSPNGIWLDPDVAHHPLRGWDVTNVTKSGSSHGVDPADIFGCLFFHVKDQLREFATRMKDLNINVYLTQFDSRVLSKGVLSGGVGGIGGGVLEAFEGTKANFDRIDLGDAIDQDGDVQEWLEEWAPLLNRGDKRAKGAEVWTNRDATILACSRTWHRTLPNVAAVTNPRALKMLMDKVSDEPKLRKRIQRLITHGSESPAVSYLIESLDAFVDHEPAFRKYLESRSAEEAAEKSGLRLRESNRIHPKRFGVPLTHPHQRTANLSRDEFYDLFILGGAGFLVRFVEFEAVPLLSDSKDAVTAVPRREFL